MIALFACASLGLTSILGLTSTLGLTSILGLSLSPGPTSAVEEVTTGEDNVEKSSPPSWSADIGMPVTVHEIVLEGSELAAKPADYKTPLIVRIDAVWPHGTAHRYDMEFYALDAGEHDLRDYLRRKDGGSTDDLPPLILTASPNLAAYEIRPSRLDPRPVRSQATYKNAMIAAAALWTIGLLAILLYGRRPSGVRSTTAARPASLAERLQPMIQAAADGTLEPTRLAELELSLVAWWRTRLGMDDLEPNQALQALLTHEEAGPLLRGIESWLHRPDAQSQENISELLAPYRDLPADSLHLPGPQPSAAHRDSEAPIAGRS